MRIPEAAEDEQIISLRRETQITIKPTHIHEINKENDIFITIMT